MRQTFKRPRRVLLNKGVQQVYISLGSDGLYAEDQAGRHVRLPCPKVQVVNATGGGDAMAAALAACIAHGKPLVECARKAAGAGALACTAAETIHPRHELGECGLYFGQYRHEQESVNRIA